MPRRPTAADGTGGWNRGNGIGEWNRGVEAGDGTGGWSRRPEPQMTPGRGGTAAQPRKEGLPPLYGSTGSRAADARR